ncbi:BREX-1 system adenine-specific DNA-methyltransferase PglX [Vibrio fluminensis]|uniref:BREX-1 system adenine-specific DNA-methyltransferase PglX n=1 Tax=Vibrio fluminensis TaxID=2783614 RepID=UPI0018871C6F|nr:BREX-1 system adenine-specific DNA-methyltransferase PglX [Vibrio fluminensis]
MNTNKLKAYAPKARVAFMQAVTKRAAHFGIYENKPAKVEDVQFESNIALIEGRIFTRHEGQLRNRLVKRIEALGTIAPSKEGEQASFDYRHGFNQLINEMAFTWFNRLTAIRYMEVNEYLDHGFRVLSMPPKVSSTEGQDAFSAFGEGFEIVKHATDVAEDLGLNKAELVEMLMAGDKDEELFRTLLLAQCRKLSQIMPLMFNALDDASELLLPDGLTKTDSLLKALVDDISEDNWRDLNAEKGQIEAIGWLYQFYISEHKDAVIGKVVKREDIPAATQLFTPNWIVKYLVQNSLGRQWMATYPDSPLKSKMDYYITPAEQSDDVVTQLKALTPTSIDPETIKVLDPACGSGHILVEVYDVLREIYLERGYRQREIPELILNNNLFGLDIDDRAAQMAQFAVLMKAREDDKRIFNRLADGDIKLNIYSLQPSEHLNIDALWNTLDFDGVHQSGESLDLFAEPKAADETTSQYRHLLSLLRYLKAKFADAKNLGSLIEIDREHLSNLEALKAKLLDASTSSNPSVKEASNTLLPIVEQALVLAKQYDVVVANPPYMGSKYHTPEVKKYLKEHYQDYEKDLFSAFMVRNLKFAREHGELGFMTPFVWMFISSYEKLRSKLINEDVISSLVQLEYSGFDGATVPICTFTITKGHIADYKGSYIRLSDFKGSANQGPKTLEAIQNRDCGWFFDAKPDDFKKIPGSPIAYWIHENLRETFNFPTNIGTVSKPRQGLATSNNDRFLRAWFEINNSKFSKHSENHDKAQSSKCRWFPYNKGGSFRKWYGNNLHVINWENNGKELLDFASSLYGSPTRTIKNIKHYFKESITWSALSSGGISLRYSPAGFIFDTKGQCIFSEEKSELYEIMALLNSRVANRIMEFLAPTLDFNSGVVAKVPFIALPSCHKSIALLIAIHKNDWDEYETSWDFSRSPLLEQNECDISKNYNLLREHHQSEYLRVIELERELNDNISDLYKYSLNENEKITDSDITLLSNTKYSFKEVNDPIKEKNLIKMKILSEFVSYSIGCMMGRYSLDREGLVYAHAGNEGFKERVAEGAYDTFPADDDGIIPLAAEEWLFEDDAASRFRQFVKTVWPEAHLQENLDFVAESLCLDAIKAKKGESAMDTIRRYLSTQFFKDHMKTYKKRPIYWLFSSGKEKAFECLVYLHRYNEGTLSRMRTEYVTPLMGKMETQLSILRDSRASASPAEQRRIDKELKSLEKKQVELRSFDEELKHYAEMKISLDLDDGVKVNYGKFGNLLAEVKAITGVKAGKK